MQSPIFVKDGDTLVLIAETPISTSDPTDEFPYVSQAFRVVADRVSPILALVPLRQTAVKISASEVDEMRFRNARLVPTLNPANLPYTLYGRNTDGTPITDEQAASGYFI